MKNFFTFFSASSAYKLLALAFICGILLYAPRSFAGTALSLNEDFDNTSFPPAGWTLAHTGAYDWLRTSYCSGYGSGTASAMFDFYDYSSGTYDLITKQFTPSGASDSLRFDHAYAPATNENDQLSVFTSTDNGSTWVLLINLAGGSAGPLRTGTPTSDLFVPTPSQWATKRYILPVGTNKIKFSAISAFGNNLYLDNIKLGTPMTNDVGVNSIFDPKWGITPQSKAPKASVKNYGTSTQSFNVTMTVNPGGYTSTQSVTSLAPGETQVITFASCSFASTGNYILKAYTSLGADPNRGNDTLSNNLVVTNVLKNVVLEYCTGTWCQWCPCGEDEAHHLKDMYPGTVMLAYHGASSDPWKVFNGSGIISALGFSGYPSGLIDRKRGTNSGWGSFFNDGELKYSQSPASNVNIVVANQSYNESTRLLTVNLNATAIGDLAGQYKVNYQITEDNMVYPQTGNSYCTGSSTWVHNWTVRSVVNTVTGDNVNTGTWVNGQTYPLTLTATLDAGWIAGNCKFNVIIFKENTTLNTSEIQQGISGPVVTTSIGNPVSGVPAKFELEQNYPNPFNPNTNIKFAIPKDGFASLKVYNLLGQLVGTYLDGEIKAGFYNAEINAADFASGIYFYTLTTKDFTETKKMNLVK